MSKETQTKPDLKQGKQVYLIGLTGNIACGKSTVLRFLQAQGAYTIDADTISHKLMQVGGSAYAPVLAAFGEGILVEPKQEDAFPPRPIDRRKLGAIVFGDAERLRQLELIVHPLVRVDMLDQIARAVAQVVVVDAIKLLENRLDASCDAVWVVTCDPNIQLERLMQRNQFSREEALLRIEAQAPQAEKVERATVVIDNSGSIANTQAQVEIAWRGLDIFK
jgi:dephospho-CoA kinase